MIDVVSLGRGGVSNLPSVRTEQSSPPSGDAFAQSLAKAIENSVLTLRNSENVAIQGVLGTASTQDVESGLLAAERSLHAAIAIRDKIVASYQEISRMSI